MDKKILTLIQINVLRDVELKLRNSQLEKYPAIVPDSIYEVLKELEAEYRKEDIQKYPDSFISEQEEQTK